MDGVRRASAHSIVFQAREGSPELNCCSVNSPRGFGMISDWALMQHNEGIVINFYGPSKMELTTSNDVSFTIHQETNYPVNGKVKIFVNPSESLAYEIKVRIPYWSEKTTVLINGVEIPDVTPGEYLVIQRIWKPDDLIELNLDMRLHYWVGEKECEGLTSVYRGPILLAFDHHHNLHLSEGQIPSVRKIDEWHPANYFLIDMPFLDAGHLKAQIKQWDDWIPPWILLEFESVEGHIVRLCDFGSAGSTGTPYRSWLKVKNVPVCSIFSRDNPLRSCHF
jgi:DUF1680 family protein